MGLNLYILLRSLLCYLMISNSYEDTSIFIFGPLVFATYIISSYKQFLSFTKLDFSAVGARLDPEHRLSFYSHCATYCHV